MSKTSRRKASTGKTPRRRAQPLKAAAEPALTATPHQWISVVPQDGFEMCHVCEASQIKGNRAHETCPGELLAERKRERLLEDIADDARRLKGLLSVVDRIANALPADTYISDWDVGDFIALVAVAHQRADALCDATERATVAA